MSNQRPRFNYNKMRGAQSQNQFINSEQQQRLYLVALLQGRNRRQTREVAHGYADAVVNRLVSKLEDGKFKIDETSSEIKDLLVQQQLTESAKRLLSNKKKNEEKSKQHSLLYPRNKSEQALSDEENTRKILTVQKHREFMNEIKLQKMQRQQRVKELKEREAREKERSLSHVQQREEKQRFDSIERKKLQIQENLRKMRENHQNLLINEKQSRYVFNQVRKKKRLYEHLKETYEQKMVLPILEQNKKRLEELKRNSVLNLTDIESHEKEYLEWKKSQQSIEKSQSSVQNSYHPPAHSKKIIKILAEEEKNKYKPEMQKKLIREKIDRVNNYTALLRERSPPEISKSIAATQRQNSRKQSQLSKRQNSNNKQLGNKYLQEAKKFLRKRSKTEQRQMTEFIEKRIEKKKPTKTMSLNSVGQSKLERNVQKNNKDEIERIVNCGEYSPEEKLKRIKIADEKLSIQLRNHESKLKLKFNKQDGQSAFNLMLTNIRAKLNLLNYYQGVQQ